MIRLLASCAISLILQTTAFAIDGELFRASFDKGLSADFAKGSAAPAASANIQLVQGLKGGGALIPDDGTLDYLAKDNILSESGSFSFWFKPSWSQGGRGIFADRPGPGEPFFMSGHNIFRASPAATAAFNADVMFGGYLQKNLFSGDWTHIVVVWDARSRRIYSYINGIRREDAFSWRKYDARNIDRLLRVGSIDHKHFGLGGVVDELRIFDHPLSDADALALYSEVSPFGLSLMDYANLAGKGETPFRIRFVNLRESDATAKFEIVFSDLSGKVLRRESREVSAKKGGDAIESILFAPPSPGDYRLTVHSGGLQLKTWEICAVDPKSVSDSMPLSSTGETKKILLEEIDCAKTLPDAKYRDDGACRVVDSPAGPYRETTLQEQGAGFAYRLEVKHPGRPHWLEIVYPDDAQRVFSFVPFQTCDINFKRVYSCGNLDGVGIICGGLQPLSGGMRSKRILFWPDSTEFMAVCASYSPGDGGAAAAKIRLYENDGPLPRLEINVPKDVPGREFGIWNEDPTMEASNWLKRPESVAESGFEFWGEKAKRIVENMRFSGRSSLSMLMLEYNGDYAASDYVLPSSPTLSASGRIPGWTDLLAVVFDREGIPFYAELNHRVSSYAGMGSFGKMIASGLSASLSDKRSGFVPDFNLAASKGEDAVEEFTDKDSLAGDGGPHSSGGLNPLHPKVQEAYLKIFRAYREKFGRYKEFRGIDIISPVQIRFDLGASCGYSDYTTRLFEKECGVSIPVASDSKKRFSARRAWLKANAWDKWISWRCEKIRDFYEKLVAELRADGVKRELIIRLPAEPQRNDVMKELASGPAKSSLAEKFREFGTDLALLSRVDGLVPLPVVEPNMEIHKNSGVERYYAFSDEFASAFKDDKFPAVLVQQHSDLEIWNSKNQRIKSFWWPVGGCIFDDKTLTHYSIPQPVDELVLENMAWLLGSVDPLFIQHGWWGCPENGDYEDYQKFHKAYRSIPRVPFAKAGASDDPVAIRVRNAGTGLLGLGGGDGGNWFYVVNKARYPVKVSFSIGGANSKIRDAVNGVDLLFKDGRVSREMAPFQVLVFRCPAEVAVSDFVQRIPEAERLRLEALLATCERKLSAYKKIYGAENAACRAIVSQAKGFFDAGKYTRAAYRLQSKALSDLDAELACNLKCALSTSGALKLQFINSSEKKLSGSIKLLDWPKWTKMRPEKSEIAFKELKPGEAFDAVFEFSGPGFPERWEQFFKLELLVDGEKPYVKTVKIAPYLSIEGPTPEIDADLSDWDGKATWYALDSEKNLLFEKDKDPRKRPGFAPYNAKMASLWNKDGLSLAFVVEDKDFIPPTKADAMYENDSLQLYFDQFDNKSKGYDDNDLVYQIGLLDGVAKAWREQAPSDQGKESAEDVKCAIKRDGAKTVYEIFIPASEFLRFKLEKDAMTGFTLLVNNRDESVYSQLSTSAAHPYPNPSAWRDLILAGQGAATASALLSADFPLEPLKDSLARAHWLKDKPELAAKNLVFNSDALKGAWREESFSFLPKGDGEVKMAIGGIWRPKGEKAPESWYRSFKVDGAAGELAPLEKWESYPGAPRMKKGPKGFEAESDSNRRLVAKIRVRKDVPVTVSFEARSGAAD